MEPTVVARLILKAPDPVTAWEYFSAYDTPQTKNAMLPYMAIQDIYREANDKDTAERLNIKESIRFAWFKDQIKQEGS